MKKQTKQKWLTALLMAGALWMNGQGIKNLTPPCTYSAPACNSSSLPSYEYVCNGGFETYSLTIDNFSELSRAYGWSSPTYATPDLYSTNSTIPYVGVPCNGLGSQASRTGTNSNRYAGIYTSAFIGSYAEYIQTELKGWLTMGEIYEISFWVSRADFQPTDNSRLDVFFSQGATCIGPIPNVAYTFDYLNSITPNSAPYPVFTVPSSQINDATNWVEVRFAYCATGNETHLIIGSYDGNPGSGTTPPTSVGSCSLTSASTNTSSAYYSYGPPYLFIDDVSIKDITPILSFNPNGACGNTSINFSLTPQAGYSPVGNYLNWNFGDGTGTTPGGANMSHAFTASGNYTVTATYNIPTSIGCSPSFTTVVNVASCCMSPVSGNFGLKNATIVSNTFTPSTPWASLTAGNIYTGNIAAPANGIITNTFSVIGGLDIKTPVTFSNCNISVNMDCAIRQYSTTTINHSYLWGCDNLWSGILSYTNLTVTNSWIEDAFMAVNAGYFLGISTHPGIIIDNVLFNKNYYSIMAGTCIMPSGNFKVTGCIFSSRNFGAANYLTSTRYTSLFPNIAAKVPAKIKGSIAQSITANTIRSNVGIYLVALTASASSPAYFAIGDVTNTISINASFTNKFDYINEGIINAASKVNIYNNSFSNITTTGLGTSLGAIYHADNHSHSTGTKVGALGGSIPTANYKNVFNTVLDGVTAVDGGALDVQYNDFNTVSRYGVNAKTWKTNSPATETVVVSNNSFSTTAYAFYAYDNQTITASVTNNTLVQTAVTYTNYYNVYINEIGKPSTASYSITSNNFSGSLYGVYAINSKNVRVVNNTIQIAKPTSTSIYNAPVWLDNSDNCFIKGNSLTCNPSNAASWNTYGVFSNASVNNVYKCNTISKVSACLKFQNACNPSSIYYNSLNNNPSDPCLYGVWLDNSGQTGPIGYNGGSWQMSDDIWGDFSTADTYAQNSSIGSTIYYDGSNTMPKPLSLYQPQVNGNSTGIGASTPYSPSSTSNLNSQTCTEAARMMNPTSGGKSGSVSGNAAESFSHAGFDNANDELVYGASNKKRLFLPVNTLSSTSKVIKGANEADFYMVDSLIDVYYQTQNLSVLNSAKNVNSAIVANNNQEQNQKDFNSIYCVYVQADSLVSTTQIFNLQNMAQLCPFTEGLAVYEARALMRNWDDTTVYFNVCENNPPQYSANSRLVNTTQTVSESMIGVYPNPTNGSLTVTCNCKDCIFVVYDIAGRIVLSQKLSENETKVDVSSLNNGTYIYKIGNNGITVKADKLILNK